MAITIGTDSYVASGLICYLDANKTSSYPGSGTVWTDLSGTGNHGTLVASPTVSNGKFNFNGSTQCITIPGVNLSASAFTVLAGSGYTGSTGGRIVTGMSNNWLMGHWSNAVKMYFSMGWVTPSIGSFDTVYRHWAATGTTNDYKLYENGTQIASGTGGTAGPNGITIGAWSQSGVLSEQSGSQCGYVMAYNRVLSVAEIQQNLAYLTQGITLSDGSVQGSAYDATTDTGKLLATQTFTASGTWTKPSGCRKVIVKVTGAGGGGASYCESGGGGGYSEKVIDVTSVSTVAVTVGGGAAAVTYYAAATQGGTSSFGSYCSATGGYGANQHAGHTGGHGGVGSSGDVNFLGGCGTGHGNTGGREAVGTGGSSYWGGPRRASHSQNSAVGYTSPGCGGTGGAMQAWVGGAGGGGLVVVYSYS